MVDRFDLAHFDEPDLDVLSGGDEYAVTVVLRLTQNLSRVQFEVNTSLILFLLRRGRRFHAVSAGYRGIAQTE